MPPLRLDTYSTPQNASWMPIALPTGVEITTQISTGTLTDNGALRVVDGVLYYRPDPGYSGTDSFAFAAVEGAESLDVTVEIEVALPETQPQTFYDGRIAPEIPTSDQAIVLTPVAEFDRVGGANQRFNSFDYTPDGRIFTGTDGRIDGEGRIYELIPEGDGTYRTELWFEPGPAILAATGLEIDNSNFIFGGLRGIAFHPDFETNGKFYISMMHQVPADPAGSTYIGPIYDRGQNGDSVVAEFTVDLATGAVIETSYRELFRISVPVDDHPIRQIEFNKFAVPGDDDYGLLYVAHGDGSIQSATSGGGLRNDALGKILRVDPLQSGTDPYSVPADNPFVATSEMPDEVYALGFRNPHTLAFSRDAAGETHLFVADVGRDNAEEINLVVAGGNYGWSAIEGLFSLETPPGTLSGVSPLTPEDTAYAIAEQAIFPASFIGHFGAFELDADGNPINGQVGGGQAIASGHAIDTASVLEGTFIFGDFAKGGRFYEADLEALLTAGTTIPDGGSTADLDWVTPAHMPILFDHDGDPATTPLAYATLLEAIDRTRTDLRFNQGPDGEMFITTKRDGTVYRVANGDPDFNDTIFGSDGADTLFGHGGDDRLLGDGGDDTIRLSAGQDTVTGGLGADLFVFSRAGGIDTVTDYQSGIDTLDLTAWSAAGIAVTERVAGPDLELVRGDTGAVIARLEGAAGSTGAPPLALTDRYDLSAAALAAAGAAGLSAGVSVLANDGDPDGDAIALASVGGAAGNIGLWLPGSDGGLFRVDADGLVEFADPDGALAPGETSRIAYGIVDATGAGASAEIVVRVTGTSGTNRPPDAGPDSFAIARSEAGSYTRLAALTRDGGLLVNDSDPDGDVLRIVGINGNGFDLSTVGLNVWFAGSNGGEFRVFDSGVVDFRFTAEEAVTGGTTGFTYDLNDSLNASDTGRVTVVWDGFANDDRYQIPSDVLAAAAAGDGLIVVGRTRDQTDALENDADGAVIAAVDGDAGALGRWVPGQTGGEFRIYAEGVVQFRNRGEVLEDGAVARIDYTVAVPGGAGETLTATIEVLLGDLARDDLYTVPGADLIAAGTGWFRLGAVNDGTTLLENDTGIVALSAIDGAPLDDGVWFAGANGGEFRVYATGVVDFRNQGDPLAPGETTSFDYTGLTAEGVASSATVTLAFDELALI